MGLMQITTLALAISFTLGCSQPPADPPPPQKTVFDPMTQQLERAKGVQNTVDQNSKATRDAVDAQERGDPPP